MKTLAIISQKGGVGKTTLATALAVEAGRTGKRTVVFDLDPQASASFWKDTRKDDLVAMTAIPAARLGHVVKAADTAGCDLAIIDTPPFSKDIAYEAAQHADFVLIPTRPAVLDVMATNKTIELLRHYDKPYAVILTFCPPIGREVDDAVEAVSQLGARICPVRIGNRIAYSRAQQTGQVAQEIEPEGKAAQEIQRLYSYVCMHLSSKDSERSKENGRKRAASGTR